MSVSNCQYQLSENDSNICEVFSHTLEMAGACEEGFIFTTTEFETRNRFINAFKERILRESDDLKQRIMRVKKDSDQFTQIKTKLSCMWGDYQALIQYEKELLHKRLDTVSKEIEWLLKDRNKLDKLTNNNENIKRLNGCYQDLLKEEKFLKKQLKEVMK